MSESPYHRNLSIEQEKYLHWTRPTQRLLTFDLETFKQRLRESIAWCQPRFSIENIEWSLRTPPIPKGYTGDDIDHDIAQLSIVFDTVMTKQASAFAKNPESNWESEGLCGGRLILSHMRPLYDANYGNEGFINYDELPAWDTWVDLIAYQPPFGDKFPVLISWIPPEILELVNFAVTACSSSQNIVWADSYNPLKEYDFCRELKAHGLYYQGPPLKDY